MKESTSGPAAHFLLILKPSLPQLVNSLCLGGETLYLVKPGDGNISKSGCPLFSIDDSLESKET